MNRLVFPLQHILEFPYPLYWILIKLSTNFPFRLTIWSQLSCQLTFSKYLYMLDVASLLQFLYERILKMSGCEIFNPCSLL